VAGTLVQPPGQCNGFVDLVVHQQYQIATMLDCLVPKEDSRLDSLLTSLQIAQTYLKDTLALPSPSKEQVRSIGLLECATPGTARIGQLSSSPSAGLGPGFAMDEHGLRQALQHHEEQLYELKQAALLVSNEMLLLQSKMSDHVAATASASVREIPGIDEQCRDELDELQDRVRAMRRQVDEAVSRAGDIPALKKRIVASEEKLFHVEETSNKRTHAMELEVNLCKHKLNRIQQEVGEITGHHSALDNALDTLGTEVQRDFEEMRASTGRLWSEMQAVTGQVDRCFKQVREESEAIRGNVNMHQERLSKSLEATAEHLDIRVDNIERNVGDVAERIDVLSATVVKQGQASWETRAESLAEDIGTVNQIVSTVRVQLQDCFDEIAGVHEKVAEVRAARPQVQVSTGGSGSPRGEGTGWQAVEKRLRLIESHVKSERKEETPQASLAVMQVRLRDVQGHLRDTMEELKEQRLQIARLTSADPARIPSLQRPIAQDAEAWRSSLVAVAKAVTKISMVLGVSDGVAHPLMPPEDQLVGLLEEIEAKWGEARNAIGSSLIDGLSRKADESALRALRHDTSTLARSPQMVPIRSERERDWDREDLEIRKELEGGRSRWKDRPRGRMVRSARDGGSIDAQLPPFA